MTGRRDPDRRTVLRQLAVGLAGGAVALGSGRSAADSDTDGTTDPLQLLRDGNARFAAGAMWHPNQGPGRRTVVAERQKPFAIIFACVDSRVAPEIVFDRGLGDLFVVRGTAQDHDMLVRGSIEYGTPTIAAPLIVVLGHQHCTTTTTAVMALESGTVPPDDINAAVQAVKPAYLLAKASLPRTRDDLVEATTRAQTHLTVATLRADAALNARFHTTKLRIVGAHYSLDSGLVSWPNY